MIIENIVIKNFRNLEHVKLIPNEKKNYIIGDNAQGKTNILESLYFLSYIKSYRTNDINNLYDKKKELSIDAVVVSNKVRNKININCQSKIKNIYLNNSVVKIKKLSEIINIIFYYPSEINLLLKFPSYRRNLIDKSIYLFNSNYVDIHNSYIKCLKNRNVCLKKNKDDYIWREKLIDLSFMITELRINYINRINKLIRSFNIYDNEHYEIYYNNYDISNYKNELKNKFKTSEEKDKKNGYTSIGPHTEDIIFNLNGNNISYYGSEGQKKTFILLYKYAQILDYESIKGDYPVFLVDDLTSELDSCRENFILNKILLECEQSFITSNSEPKKLSENTSIFYVNNGMIS